MPNQVRLRADGSIDQTILDVGNDWIAQTITANAITFTETLVTLSPGSPTTGELHTITNGGTGKLLILRPASGKRVLLKRNIGNIRSASGDVLLANVDQHVVLMYDGDSWNVVTCGCGATNSTGGEITPPEWGAANGACIAARRMTEMIAYIIDGARSKITNTLIEMAEVLAARIAIVLPGFSPASTLTLAGTLKTAYATATALDADFTSTFYGNLRNMIYCVIGADGQLSLLELEALRARSLAYSSIPWGIIGQIVALLGTTGMNNSILASTTITEGCVCDAEWCYTWDFTAGNGGWSVGSDPGGTQGIYVAGAGWRTALLSYSNGIRIRALNIYRTFTSASVTSMEMQFSYTAGMQSASGDKVATLGLNGYGIFVASQNTISTPSSPFSGMISPTVATRADAQLLVGNVGEGVDPGGEATLTRLAMRGTGINPFGTDNCA